MFNLLAKFDNRALNGLLKQGHRYFVRQTFNQAREAFDNTTKALFLICHYKDGAKAKEHFDVLTDDPNRFLYSWDAPEHQERLKVDADGPEGYKIFSNTFIEDWENHITDRFRSKIRAYIDELGWKPSRNDVVKFDFFPRFGEPFATLRFKKQAVEVSFEEIDSR